MIRTFRRSPALLIAMLALLLSISACKSSKKAAEAARLAAEKQEQEAKRQKEEDQRKQAALENERMDAEARKQREASEKAGTPYTKLNQYFDAIANSGNATAANSSIQEALSLFKSDDTPVLIVISGTGDQKDYDRPTTIRNYLNYLKDQKKNSNKIENLQFDDSGKITEVELRKN